MGTEPVIAHQITSDGVKIVALPPGTTEFKAWEFHPERMLADPNAPSPVTNFVCDVNVYDGGLRLIERRT